MSLNISLVVIVLVIAAVIVGITFAARKKVVWVIAPYILGAIALWIGIMLFPATMWRSIAAGFLAAGAVLWLIAAIFTFRGGKRNG